MSLQTTTLHNEYDRRRKAAGQPGYWFSPASMRFFGTRIANIFTDEYAPTVVFTTSEQPPHGPRKYSVRIMGEDGQIETFGPFAEMSSARAESLARYAVEHGITADQVRRAVIEQSDDGFRLREYPDNADPIDHGVYASRKLAWRAITRFSPASTA